MSYTFNQITSKATCNGVKMSVAGCGCCSIASIAYNIRPETDLHETVFRHMASKGYMPAGSTREGMSATMKHFGLTISKYDNGSSYKSWVDAVVKTGYGVVLVHGSNAGWAKKPSTYFTAGGHYLAITSVRKASNGSYDFYIRDSGQRKRTGWHNVEKELKTCYVSGWALTFPGAVNDLDKASATIQTVVSQTKTEYLPIYHGTSKSIVMALSSLGIEYTYGYRSMLAAKNGINDYRGTDAQNTALLTLLKKGKLIKA